MRRRNHQIVLLLLLALAAMAQQSTRLQAALIRHSGTVDPELEDGYVSQPGNQFWANVQTAGWAGTVGPADGIAWQINAASNGFRFYTETPLLADRTAGSAIGWTLRTTLRLPTTSDAAGEGVMVDYGDGSRLWQMHLGTNVNGDPIVTLPLGSTYTLTGAGNANYHTYELVYDPANSNVDLFVDGIEQISNYGGFAAGVSRVLFGDGDTLEVGTGNYALVQWEVPEPSMFVGMTIAAAGLLLRRRK